MDGRTHQILKRLHCLITHSCGFRYCICFQIQSQSTAKNDVQYLLGNLWSKSQSDAILICLYYFHYSATHRTRAKATISDKMESSLLGRPESWEGSVVTRVRVGASTRSHWVRMAWAAPSHCPGPCSRYWYGVQGSKKTERARAGSRRKRGRKWGLTPINSPISSMYVM